MIISIECNINDCMMCVEDSCDCDCHENDNWSDGGINEEFGAASLYGL